MSSKSLLVNQSQIQRTIKEAMGDSEYMKRIEEKKSSKDETIREYTKRLEYLKSNPEIIAFKTKEFASILKEIEAERSFERFWIHVDLDMFFVACEIRDNPSLKDKPVAVGSSVISTSNYIARRYGVRSAMPTFVAKRLCPQLVLVPSNFAKYKSASLKFMSILRDYDPDLESLGSDEGRLDVTEYLEQHGIAKNQQNLEKLMNEIRARIYAAIRVTASSGCAANKMLAKLCSEVNKPNGQYFLQRDKNSILEFLDDLKIRKIPGIGPQCEYILNGMGVSTVLNLRNKLFDLFLVLRENWLVALARRAYGISNIYHSKAQDRKSISCSRTFRATHDRQILLKQLDYLANDIHRRAKAQGFVGRGVSLIIKTSNFKVKQRSKKLKSYSQLKEDILRVVRGIFEAHRITEKIRLLGIRLDDLKRVEEYKKSNLFNFFKNAEICVDKGKKNFIEVLDEVQNGAEVVEVREMEAQRRQERLMRDFEREMGDDLDGLKSESVAAISVAESVGRLKEPVICDVDDVEEVEEVGISGSKNSVSGSFGGSGASRRRFLKKNYIQAQVECPICHQIIQTDGNIRSFNRHLDKCLAASEGGGGAQERAERGRGGLETPRNARNGSKQAILVIDSDSLSVSCQTVKGKNSVSSASSLLSRGPRGRGRPRKKARKVKKEKKSKGEDWQKKTRKRRKRSVGRGLGRSSRSKDAGRTLDSFFGASNYGKKAVR